MNKEVELLSDLLGEYQDLENKVYQEYLKTIQSGGVLIQSPKLDSVLLNKINPTWIDLLNEHCVTIYDSWNFGPRNSVKKPLLIDSEIYEFFLLFNNQFISIGKKTVKEWRQRITNQGIGAENNFISSVPNQMYEFIKNNSFVLKVVLHQIDVKIRSEIEAKLFLNDNPQAYIKHLLDRSLSDYNSILKSERGQLFNAPNFKDLSKTREYLLNQHFNAFGLKDIIHIRYVLENLKDKLISNEQLINEVPANVLLQRENLLYFSTCLQLKIPFSGR